MKQVELHYGAASDVGLVRKVNEDAYFASPPIFVVADGMGGHDGGDVASAIVAEEFAALAEGGYDPRHGQSAIEDTLASCQARITDYGRAQIAQGKAQWYAGTTVVAALLVEDEEGVKWLLCNLGDSRIYRLSQDQLVQVSTDHSVVQELVDAGSISSDDAATHPERHVITRALGGPDRADADFFLLELPAVERLLLCSDGISGMVADQQISSILTAAEDPRDAADQLVAAALQAGGRDNATAVVVDVVGWTEEAYDSDRQRQSLEKKLGALP